jgi:hypothetical protein
MNERRQAMEEGLTNGQVIDELIRQRACEISQGEDAGFPEENWERAPQELRPAGDQVPETD